jgi:hypothetical protein
MNPNVPRGIARALITEADHLSRLVYDDGEDVLAARFAAIRTELASIERRCGANPPRRVSNVEVELAHEHIRNAVFAAAGHAAKGLLDRITLLSERLRPPRPRTLVGI